VTAFYAVSHSFWDNGPDWDYHIIEVKADGSAAVVRDVLVISTHPPCGPSCTVKAKIKRVPNTTPAALVGDNNPCAIDVRELVKELHRTKRALKRTPLFTTADFGIVATCGGENVLLRFPMLAFPFSPHGSPRVTRAYGLISDIEQQVFDTSQVFTTAAQTKVFEGLEGSKPSADDEVLGASILPELRSGVFDQALWDDCRKPSCAGQGMKRVLETYVPPEERRQPRVSWIDRPGYACAECALPDYPAIARLARVEGNVTLDLAVDEGSGRVLDATPLSGPPVLLGAAVSAAKGWRFQPESKHAHLGKSRATIRFAMNCNWN
jgi:hypothetical protein